MSKTKQAEYYVCENGHFFPAEEAGVKLVAVQTHDSPAEFEPVCYECGNADLTECRPARVREE